jgi:hypothetical protein
MSYTLADGSLSTEFIVGDKSKVANSSTSQRSGLTLYLDKDDGTSLPFFHQRKYSGRFCEYWKDLIPVKKQEEDKIIKKLRKKVKKLKKALKELNK